jgi:branched-chain amino acid transport system ATP-binding protein
VPDPLLETRALTVRFGGLTALCNLNLTVGDAELIGVIGPNGAGKTTFFNAVSGIVAPTGGSLSIDGVDLTGRAPYVLSRRGVARTFQTPRVFPTQSVLENVMFGLRFGRARHKVRDDLPGAARELLRRLELEGDAESAAGALPPSRQRLLEVAIALGTGPRLLLLDEVAAGLTDREADRTAALIRKLHGDLSIAVIWIEHAVGTLMRTVDRILVLNYGELIADGPPGEVARNPGVIDAYLGTNLGTNLGTPPATHQEETGGAR